MHMLHDLDSYDVLERAAINLTFVAKDTREAFSYILRMYPQTQSLLMES